MSNSPREPITSKLYHLALIKRRSHPTLIRCPITDAMLSVVHDRTTPMFTRFPHNHSVAHLLSDLNICVTTTDFNLCKAYKAVLFASHLAYLISDPNLFSYTSNNASLLHSVVFNEILTIHFFVQPRHYQTTVNIEIPLLSRLYHLYLNRSDIFQNA